jgi:hypothetical protein
VSIPDHDPFIRDEVVLKRRPGRRPGERAAGLDDRALARGHGLVLLAVDGGGAPGSRLSVSPNPFRGAATMLFSLPGTRNVDIAVFDVLGRRVRTLRSGMLGAREHRLVWDGQRDGGTRAPGGSTSSASSPGGSDCP